MSLATHSGQLFQVTIVPLDNCSSQNLFLRSFTNGHLQRGRSLEWTIEYLPQLLQSLISLTDDNRKNKDQNSNKRFALFTLSSFCVYIQRRSLYHAPDKINISSGIEIIMFTTWQNKRFQRSQTQLAPRSRTAPCTPEFHPMRVG